MDFGRAIVDAEGADLAETCSTIVSVETPVPPITCTQRSATRISASDTATLAIELSAVPSEPVSSTPAHQSIISSDCFRSIRFSASMKPTPS